jgi:hypothetical protein
LHLQRGLTPERRRARNDEPDRRRQRFRHGDDACGLARQGADRHSRAGYADNPVARKNNVVAKLLAATDAVMDGEVKKPGAKELAAAFP